MTANAVEFHNISKTYRVYEHPGDRLIELITRRQRHSKVSALHDVSFVVPRGTTFGIVGRNGSGKSTALQIMASVLQPSSGSFSVRGRVSALLELGSGFNPEFTGVENVYLYASILGLTKEEIDERLQGILAFADIGEFVHRPVKTYSSGMVVRLAFSVAVSIQPDILIVDEALSVGDALFQHKCVLRMRRIIETGATVIFVSHDIGTVKLLCQSALLLEHGRVVAIGDAESVARTYHRRLFHQEVERQEPPQGGDFGFAPRSEIPVGGGSDVQNPSMPQAPLTWPSSYEMLAFSQEHDDKRFGTGAARIVGLHIFNDSGERSLLIDYGHYFTVRIFIRFLEATSAAVAGMVLRNSRGVDILATNTHIEHTPIAHVREGELVAVDFVLQNILRDDHYSISAAVTHEHFFNQARPYDWIDNAVVIRAATPKESVVYGFFYPTDLRLIVRRASEEQPSLPISDVTAEHFHAGNE